MIAPVVENLSVDWDQWMPVPDALKLHPKIGYRPGKEVCWRWRDRGVNGAKLHAERVGKVWKTTLNHVDKFINGQNGQSGPVTATSPVDGPDSIDAQLRAAGIL